MFVRVEYSLPGGTGWTEFGIRPDDLMIKIQLLLDKEIDKHVEKLLGKASNQPSTH